MAAPERPSRGLSSLREARERREARKDAPSASSRFWLWSLLVIAALTVFYLKITGSEADAKRTRILSKERVIAEELGPRFNPTRDAIERWTMETAGAPPSDDLSGLSHYQPAALATLLGKPGVFFRTLLPEATSVESIRSVANLSLKDAFTECFLKIPQVTTSTPHACKLTKECAKGEMCNALGSCSVPTQPYNLRLLYWGMRVTSEKWTQDVETATDPLRLRMFEGDLEDASANDLPLVADLLNRSRYYLVALDEPPAQLTPTEGETRNEAVQALVHPTRVALYDLTSKQLIFRARRTIDVPVPVLAGSENAVRRQVYNCTLGTQLRQLIKLDPAP